MQYLHDVRNIDLLTYTWPTTFNLIKLKHVKLKHMDQMQEQMPTTKKPMAKLHYVGQCLWLNS